MMTDIPINVKAKSFFYLVGVVLQQDMRGRFQAGSYFGYIMTLLWPLFHLAVLTVGFLLRTVIAPMGDDPAIFVATGATPYIMCFYPARMMGTSITENRQLLHIPLIRPIHLMASRCLLEILNAIIVLSIFVGCATLMGVDLTPEDPRIAFSAVMASISLGIGIGIFNATMVAITSPFYMMFFTFAFMALYLTAGVYIPINMLPERLARFAQYNPVATIVTWMRSAYYSSVELDNESKIFVLLVAGAFFSLGLVGERLFRGRFLS